MWWRLRFGIISFSTEEDNFGIYFRRMNRRHFFLFLFFHYCVRIFAINQQYLLVVTFEARQKLFLSNILLVLNFCDIVLCGRLCDKCWLCRKILTYFLWMLMKNLWVSEHGQNFRCQNRNIRLDITMKVILMDFGAAKNMPLG